MLVLFKNIPPNTKKKDLLAIVEPAIKRHGFFYRLFSLPGAVVDIAFLNLFDNDNNMVNFHAVVMIMPDDIAVAAIKQLDRKVVNGRRVTVREFHIRSEKNDPRRNHEPPPPNLLNQRLGDRRKHDLVPCPILNGAESA